MEKVRYMGISMHNVGAELEQLENFEDSIKHYKKSYEFIREHIGLGDPLY